MVIYLALVLVLICLLIKNSPTVMRKKHISYKQLKLLFLILFVCFLIFIIRDETPVTIYQCPSKLLQRIPVTIDINGIHFKNWFLGSKNYYDISNSLPVTKPNKTAKVILLYTTLFGSKTWTRLDGSSIGTRLSDVNCPARNCEITYDKMLLPTADAVIFHGVDLLWNPESQPDRLFNISQSTRPSWQRWVFFMHEPPPKNEKDYYRYNWIFNWTASYRRNSDIFIPYSYYERIGINEIPTVDRNYAERKTRVIVWAVSHCGLIRENFVLQLQKYIDVTVYGQCMHHFDKPGYECMHRTTDCFETISTFKFYLAFENSFCEDYVTEKYWENAIKVNTVPVVLGANYDSKLVIPGSYIEADKFDSIEKLAKYLNYLNKNDTAYNEYFEWKKYYKPINFDPVCAFCEKLHDDPTPARIYHDIGRFWSVEEQCRPFEEKKCNIQDLIKESKQRRKRSKTGQHNKKQNSRNK